MNMYEYSHLPCQKLAVLLASRQDEASFGRMARYRREEIKSCKEHELHEVSWTQPCLIAFPSKAVECPRA